MSTLLNRWSFLSQSALFLTKNKRLMLIPIIHFTIVCAVALWILHPIRALELQAATITNSNQLRHSLWTLMTTALVIVWLLEIFHLGLATHFLRKAARFLANDTKTALENNAPYRIKQWLYFPLWTLFRRFRNLWLWCLPKTRHTLNEVLRDNTWRTCHTLALAAFAESPMQPVQAMKLANERLTLCFGRHLKLCLSPFVFFASLTLLLSLPFILSFWYTNPLISGAETVATLLFCLATIVYQGLHWTLLAVLWHFTTYHKAPEGFDASLLNNAYNSQIKTTGLSS